MDAGVGSVKGAVEWARMSARKRPMGSIRQNGPSHTWQDGHDTCDTILSGAVWYNPAQGVTA